MGARTARSVAGEGADGGPDWMVAAIWDQCYIKLF